MQLLQNPCQPVKLCFADGAGICRWLLLHRDLRILHFLLTTTINSNLWKWRYSIVERQTLPAEARWLQLQLLVADLSIPHTYGLSVIWHFRLLWPSQFLHAGTTEQNARMQEIKHTEYHYIRQNLSPWTTNKCCLNIFCTPQRGVLCPT